MSVTLNEEFPVGTEQHWFGDEICRQNKSAFPFFVCSYYQILEKGMVTYSSILPWRIPWTEAPGRLQSMELQSQTQLSNYHTPIDLAALQC